MDEERQLDRQVRRQVYDVAMHRGKPPLIEEISSPLNLSPEDVQCSLQRLAAGRALVLQAGTGEVLMANPFSAVPTPFLVAVSGFSCYGNCIWDALGIPAMLRRDARIRTACADCGLDLELRVINGRIQGDSSLIHFAIPAHHWWDDIVFSWNTMLLFRSEEHVDRWCRQGKLPRGALLTLEQGRRLAQSWYGPDRREPTWRRKTVRRRKPCSWSLN